MAKPDVHGAAILQVLRTTEQPMLMSEVAAEVGCSKARAYAWLEANRGLVVAVAKRGRGGAAYMARDNVHRGKVATRPDMPAQAQSNGTVTIGSKLLIVGMALHEGRVVLELRSDGGTMLSAEIMD